VRRHCQIRAGHSGRPVSASQITIVSRWLAIAVASGNPACAMISAITTLTEAQIAPADCSARPGCGYPVVSGADARAITWPAPSTITALVLVVT